MDDVAVGWDSDGIAYTSTEELWHSEAGQGGAAEEVDEEKHSQWYRKGVEYWQGVDASVSGVLGGHERLNNRDVADSREFIRHAFGPEWETEEGEGNRRVALDCGAGVGRVTKSLLLDYFHEVDLAEPVAHFLEAAKRNLGEGAERLDGHSAKEFYCVGLQELTPLPGRYDCIWIQWCAGHLTDEDFPKFFQRAKSGLKPGGVFILKENQAREGFVFDKEDSSVTRSDPHFRKLFEECGLHVYRSKAQRGWPQELFPVHMYALTLEPRPETDEGVGRQTRSRKKNRNVPARIVD